ncbi:MAG TPA: hypothetical protein VMR66_01730 [Gemmatimonadota bacterium]|nr:hypothetical protein [Gemmatimonadota bacterium]
MGALIPRGAACAAIALPLALASPARAQPDPGPALQLAAFAGALRVGNDLATSADAQWTPVVGGRVGWRPTPQFTLSGEAWRGSLERAGEDGGSADLTGLGAFATFRPWIDRGWPADLVFDFGLESVDADDEEDRGPGFVFGLGVERRVAGRALIEAGARHHFLTVDEAEVDGIATGRDAEMWEIRAGVSLVLGGDP